MNHQPQLPWRKNRKRCQLRTHRSLQLSHQKAPSCSSQRRKSRRPSTTHRFPTHQPSNLSQRQRNRWASSGERTQQNYHVTIRYLNRWRRSVSSIPMRVYRWTFMTCRQSDLPCTWRQTTAMIWWKIFSFASHSTHRRRLKVVGRTRRTKTMTLYRVSSVTCALCFARRLKLSNVTRCSCFEKLQKSVPTTTFSPLNVDWILKINEWL